MKSNIFETRQRAEQLLQEAIAIWQKSDRSDELQDLDKDPVFKLLLTALAYQYNETESDIENMKTEVLEDFADSLVPYESCHAMPTTAVISTMPGENVEEVRMDHNSVFTLAGTEYKFTPLLNTRVLNANIESIKRLDGRRWLVRLVSDYVFKDLSGFAFALKGTGYKDLKISVNDKEMVLIHPWDLHNLPYTEIFNFDSQVYNLSNVYNSSTVCMDLFARQNTRYFVFDGYEPDEIHSTTDNTIDLVFEFFDTNADFVFDKSQIVLNPVILVNARMMTTHLSNETPLVRVAGERVKFMHLVKPNEEQLFGMNQILVRRVAADKFNSASLVKLLNLLLTKFNSDFYAFHQLNTKNNNDDKIYHNLYTILNNLMNDVRGNGDIASGVYLTFRAWDKIKATKPNLEVKYVVTDGVLAGGLTQDSKFTAPAGISTKSICQIAKPEAGFDEIELTNNKLNLAKYYIATSDRIVTSADIKAFCCTELATRYSIDSKIIKSVKVNRKISDVAFAGYEILTEIEIEGNSLIKKSFTNKLPDLEMLLEKMIEVRNINIYPIKVKIKLN